MEEIAETVTTNALRLSASINNSAKRLYTYLDETDMQAEITTRLKNLRLRSNSSTEEKKKRYYRRFSMPAVTTTNEPVTRPRLASTAATANTKSHLFLMGGVVCSPYVPMKRKTNIPLTMHESDYNDSVFRRYSRPSSAGRSSIRTESLTSGYNSATSTTEICASEQSHEKDGKLFLSGEYSSDEGLLFVFVTQCGNIVQIGKGRKLYACFRQIQNGVVSKKHVRKLENSRFSDDFRYNYTYTVPFDSYDQMVKSGVTVQIKLKFAGIFTRKKTLKTMELSCLDVEQDPVWRTEKWMF